MNKQNYFSITWGLHDDITDLYEICMDETKEKRVKKVEEIKNKLNELL